MIYAVARQAGFSPDQSATMTAVALAESGGNTSSHNPVNEDSRGLWQINALAHPDLVAQFPNLYDPVQNAKAAFLVSNGGKDMSPWTTTHGGAAARYLRYRADAEQAAIAYGDGPGHGVWTGTAAYGDHESAGSAAGAGAGIHAVSDSSGSVSAGGQVTMTGAPTSEDRAISAPPTTVTTNTTAGGGTTAANTTADATTATSTADGSSAVVADAAATNAGPAAGHDTRPGADYGIPLAAPTTTTGTPTATGTQTGSGTGTQTLDAPGHTASAGGNVRLGADFGIPLAGSTPAATAADSAAQAAATPATTPTATPATPTPAAPTTPADPTTDHNAAPPVPTIPSPATQSADAERLQEFLHAAVAQTGDQYIYGANADFNNPHPSAFDCSDLVQWATHRVGISMPRTASEQYEFLKHGGHVIPVDQAVHTPGALLFNFSSNPDDGQPEHGHVAISLGNGKTMEALGPQYGVGSWNANSTRFNYAAVIPGLSPGVATTGAPATAPAASASAPGTSTAAAPADAHHADAHQADAHPQTTASLVDAFEARMATDPHAMDTHASILNASQQMTAAPTGPSADHSADAAGHTADPAGDHSTSTGHDSADHHVDQHADAAHGDHHTGPDAAIDHHDGTDHATDAATDIDPGDHTDPALASAMLWYPEPEQHDHLADHYTDHNTDHFAATSSSTDHSDPFDAGIH